MTIFYSDINFLSETSGKYIDKRENIIIYSYPPFIIHLHIYEFALNCDKHSLIIQFNCKP